MVHNVDNPSAIWFVGDEMGDEIRFDLAAADSVAFIDTRGLPGAFKPLFGDSLDEFVSIVWKDGSRLNLAKEK